MTARLAAAALIASVLGTGSLPVVGADDTLARARAAYAQLRSYSDTGTVVTDTVISGARILERGTFRTVFREPRHFLFEFVPDAAAGPNHFAIWSDAQAFHTWWAATGIADTYPTGSGLAAFASGAGITAGSLMLTAPLLFHAAGLAGGLTELTDLSAGVDEVVQGRACHRVNGLARSVYGATGHETTVRSASVWIDAETFLVRQMFWDTPRGSPAGTVVLTTITLEPKVNPALDDAQFRFTPPTQRLDQR